MDIVNIEALVAQHRIVKTADIDPNNDYVVIGKWQKGTNKYRGAGNSYASYAVPLSELLGGGSTTPITLNVIPKGTGPSIADGTWAFSVNDIIPLTSCSNIGSLTNRVKTIYMCSEIDYATDMHFISGVNTTFTMTTDGRFYGNATTSIIPSNAGFQYNSSVANRANFRANAFTADANGAGSTYFKSRGASIGTLASVIDGDVIGHQTYIAVTGNNTNIPLAALVTITVPVGGVTAAHVAANWNLELTNLVGVRNRTLQSNSEGVLTVTSSGEDFITGSIDPLGRKQTWSKYSGGIFRMGSDTADGDPTDIDSEGIVIYHPSDDRTSRIKADRFGLTAASDTSLYYFRADPNRLFYKDVALNPLFNVDRATGNTSIGNVAGTAKLHVKGVGSSTATLGLQVEDLSGNAWLRVYDDGTLWSQGLANNSHLFNTLAGNISFTLDSPGIQYFEFKTAGVIQSQLINQTNLTRFNQAANQFWGVYGSDNNPYILFDETNKNVGIGTLTPTSRLDIRGVDATAGNYALKVGDITGNPLLYVRNDGYITTIPVNDSVSFLIGNKFNGDSTLKVQADSAGRGFIVTENADIINGNAIQFVVNNTGTRSVRGLSNAAGGVISSLNIETTGLGISGSAFISTAMVEVRGAGNNSGSYAAKIGDFFGVNLLSVRDDGQINAPLLPTSGTGFPPGGLAAGDFWVDTLTMTVKIV